MSHKNKKKTFEIHECLNSNQFEKYSNKTKINYQMILPAKKMYKQITPEIELLVNRFDLKTNFLNYKKQVVKSLQKKIVTRNGCGCKRCVKTLFLRKVRTIEII